MARGSITPRPSKDGKRMSYRIKWESRGLHGKRQHHSATRATKKEAEKFLADKLKEVNDGTFVVASRENVSAFLERWLNASAPDWTEGTRYQYRSTIRNRIDPLLGHVPLAKLDELTIQQCYSSLSAKGYAPASIAMAHAILDGALAQAVAWRLLPRNPADGVTAPLPAMSDVQAWSAEEAQAFLVETRDDAFWAVWRLGLDSGMRVGEMLALKWGDLDTESGVVSVRRTLTRIEKGRYVIGEHPKTSSSRRAIPLDAETVAALRGLRVPQVERRMACGPRWVDLDLIFDNGDGARIHPNRIRYQFDRAVRRAGVPPLTPHGMRHTMATLLLKAGIHPKIVQERLGHKSIQMTLDRYSHVTMSMQLEAAEAIGAILGGVARPRRGHGAG